MHICELDLGQSIRCGQGCGGKGRHLPEFPLRCVPEQQGRLCCTPVTQSTDWSSAPLGSPPQLLTQYRSMMMCHPLRGRLSVANATFSRSSGATCSANGRRRAIAFRSQAAHRGSWNVLGEGGQQAERGQAEERLLRGRRGGRCRRRADLRSRTTMHSSSFSSLERAASGVSREVTWAEDARAG